MPQSEEEFRDQLSRERVDTSYGWAERLRDAVNSIGLPAGAQSVDMEIVINYDDGHKIKCVMRGDDQ